MLEAAIVGGLVGGTVPWVLKTAGKRGDQREGLILIVTYGAAVGLIFDLLL
ncbi:MAG: hypothetical protein AAF409_09585 [Pseudomonadota bacterium]